MIPRCVVSRWTSHTREELEAFHKASPSLAYWLERWKADRPAETPA